MKNVIRLFVVTTAVILTACSLTRPAPPPAPEPEWMKELAERPQTTHEAALSCARTYGREHANTAGATTEQIAQAAVVACKEPIGLYKAALVEDARYKRRGFGGFGHPTLTRVMNQAASAEAEAYSAALEAVISMR